MHVCARQQIPSYIAVNDQFLPPENLNTNKHLETINNCTKEQEKKINFEKTKYMIFNFCHFRQFQTRVSIDETLLEQVKETKLLGLIISDDLSWHSNTNNLVKKAYMRMNILRKLYDFNVPKAQLIQIYMLYIRSVTEQSSVVWSSSITEEESNALEGTQKVALRFIYRNEYISYDNALNLSKLLPLSKRRENLLYKFALKTFKNPKTSYMIR